MSSEPHRQEATVSLNRARALKAGILGKLREQGVTTTVPAELTRALSGCVMGNVLTRSAALLARHGELTSSDLA